MTTATLNDTGQEMHRFNGAPLPDGSAEVPARVRLAPWGRIDSTHGSFTLDDEAAAAVLTAFRAHGTDIPIDYEHQTLGGPYASPTGRAPAAGWIKELTAAPGEGLIARVEWTDEARTLLANRAYRYLSPVALVRRRDSRMVALHSAALTNKPAIIGMDPIVNRDEPPADGAGALDALRMRLDMRGGTDTAAILQCACRRLDELSADRAAEVAESRVARAMSAGKLAPAQREWALSLARESPMLFEEWERTAPVIVAAGATAPPRADGAPGARRRSIEAAARAEFRAQPLLRRLTDEQAYVADALRSAGLTAED